MPMCYVTRRKFQDGRHELLINKSQKKKFSKRETLATKQQKSLGIYFFKAKVSGCNKIRRDHYLYLLSTHCKVMNRITI